MEARAAFRGPRVSRTFVAGVLVMAALGVGATGGYVVANLSGARVASPSNIAPHAVLGQSQGGPQSDLTRALPTAAPAAVLPDWMVREITPKVSAAPRVLQGGPNYTER